MDTTGVLSGKTISKIAAGGYMTYVVSTLSNVYSCGSIFIPFSSTFVGPGDGSATIRYTPITVSTSALGSKTISDIKATGANVVVLTSDGYVFAMGDGLYGQVRTLVDISITFSSLEMVS
jgi:alpha-tubulin suppressor-like RCC1 family protein